jgi:SpoIIAA-like
VIKTDIISGNVLRILVPDKIKAEDVRQIEPQVDSIISQYGKIRLLIDASGFNGWENIGAFENQAGFVKSHQQKVDRIAVIGATESKATRRAVERFAKLQPAGYKDGIKAVDENSFWTGNCGDFGDLLCDMGS